MGVLGRLARALMPERRDAAAGVPNAHAAGFGLLPGTPAVSSYAAENLSTVTACINAISSALATLPAFVYQHQPGGGRAEAAGHPVARLIRRPNPRQTWPDWLEMTLAQALLHGNALSEIQYDGAGRVTALVPIPWHTVVVSLLPSGELAYDVTGYPAPWGDPGATRRLLEGQAFHLRDRSDDGYIGRSRLSRAPAVLGNALDLQGFVGAMWRNNATPSGVLSMPGTLSKEAAERLGKNWSDNYAGINNARKTLVLEQGLTWQSVSVSPEDAEVLASRRFTVEEICRLYQTPCQIVQDLSHGTFSNSEQAGLWFAQLTLAPWARKVEAEFSRSVFGDGSDCHLEIDLSGLMRGDYTARWAAHAIAIDKRILTADEIRAVEGWNPRARPAADGDGAG